MTATLPVRLTLPLRSVGAWVLSERLRGNLPSRHRYLQQLRSKRKQWGKAESTTYPAN